MNQRTMAPKSATEEPVMRSVNPANGEVLEAYPMLSDRELEASLARADEAFRDYRKIPLEQRRIWLEEAAAILDGQKRRWAELMTLEMGKPIKGAVAEVEKCASVCRYYAAHGAEFLTDEPVEAAASRSWVAYQPIGPVLAVMPWNFPFWQVFRFAAPALMAGNVGLLKHASNVPGCALAIQEVFLRAGFPEGVFQTLLIGSGAVEKVVADHRVRAATLTGSEGAGSAVAASAGKVLKKTVLELGGSDPFIVMPSADLDAAVVTAVQARNINNGQSCIASKRFIVHSAIAGAFIDGFVARTKALVVGDPLEEATDVGPLATESIRDELADQVERSVAAGARVRTGGYIPERAGWYYTPTVLTDLDGDNVAACEETFGPVAAVLVVGSVDEAIELANATEFGLGASVWTRESSEVDRFVAEVEAGCMAINRMVASDPRLPFGGVKKSGYGRELGRWGMHEFLNIKAVAADGV
jgi:succinate-semialdehyde dehydrogenase / glutarate-semialdehyde dehydrogenase